jgi:predicted lipoprotein
MGERNEAGAGADVRAEPVERNARRSRLVWAAFGLVGTGVFLWIFPLFHVVPLRSNGGQSPMSVTTTDAGSAGVFDAAAFAATFWRGKLQPAAGRAKDVGVVLTALRRDPAATVRHHATQVGIGGTNYYFVRGTGRVIAVEKGRLVVAVEGAEGATVAVRVGPLFGNALRDGTGLLNVNEFPGLQEFNALAAELNRWAETEVVSPLRERVTVGGTLIFAGCAEAPETIGDGPWLTLVPLQLEVRP